MTTFSARLTLAATLPFLVGRAAAAQDQAEPCPAPLDAAGAVRCALARSPEVRRAGQELAALEGRRLTAGTLLPSQPELALELARRSVDLPGGEASTRNWGVTLSQQIELPGKRASRLAEVDAERAGARRRLAAVEREVAAGALTALLAAASADEALALARELERGAEALRAATGARAAEGLIAPLEADLAWAEATRLGMQSLEVGRRRTEARTRLAALLGLPDPERLPSLRESLLAAWAAARPSGLALAGLVERALAMRADLAAADAQRLAATAREDRLRWARVPDPTLSLFALRDGFDERVVGGGLSLPLVLPAPLGPSGQGEIREAHARREQAALDVEALRRRVREEVGAALAAWQARREALGRFTPQLLARAREHVVALGEAVRTRQLSPREALLAQRAFIEILQSHLEARLAEAVSFVELGRVAALELPGVTP
jgi:cobalt-zinc-cadmium efflux system outer membrane protein